ncbi:MAG: Asp-tRNA(Asn)/Glu-tRNA(Gln) amidotransferase subunit GatC [Firmicutes bacterium]|nr:Asp-tRNA(Asn)/Glu-tRNA(Gln) amidotransferase subunit GatC [Bacillota bacterium]
MIFDYLGYEEGKALASEDGEKAAPDANGIDDELIKYLEELSRLTLTEDEEKKAKEDLTKILDYIDTLNQLDTDNVEPMSHPFPYTNNFRDDEVKPSEERELILKNAPQQKDGCFKVPTTVE